MGDPYSFARSEPVLIFGCPTCVEKNLRSDALKWRENAFHRPVVRFLRPWRSAGVWHEADSIYPDDSDEWQSESHSDGGSLDSCAHQCIRTLAEEDHLSPHRYNDSDWVRLGRYRQGVLPR
jgi:hypothetical protein